MTSSACNAPACFIARKIAIISRGVTPMAFAGGNFSIVGISAGRRSEPSFHPASYPCASVSVLPVRLNAPGWETSSVLAMEMVNSPCETAHGAMRMRAVA